MFLPGLEGCEPLFDDLGSLFYVFETREELLKGFERVLKCFENAWEPCFMVLRPGVVFCLDLEAVSRSAARAASRKTKSR